MYIKTWQTWLFITYLSLIIFVTLQPGDKLFLNSIWKYDKIIHFIEYLILGFLLINALKIKPIKKIHWYYSFLFLIIFPIIDESLQYFTPSRVPDIYDAFADIIGGTVGALIRKYI